MEFMADHLFDGRKFRLLTLVDDVTRESLLIELDQRPTGNEWPQSSKTLGEEGAFR